MLINPLNQLYKDFLIILEQSVIKYKTIADNNETLEMKKSADRYIRAYRNEDGFLTYFNYEKEDIAKAVFDLSYSDMLEHQNDPIINNKLLLIDEYYEDRNKIPYNSRDRLLHLQRTRIVNNYVEKNNYYRCLNGQPDYGDDNYFYVTEEEIIKTYQIDKTVPVHLLRSDKISILKSIGYIDKLIANNPDKKYLKFLGSSKINLITARTARNFSLLRIPYSISEIMWNNFAHIYEQSREYFMTCIYISEYKKIIDYYDNFIAMCIMIMTLQQIMARVIKTSIERDFFDDYCVRILFEAYGIPYNERMDTNTRKLLLQNLNILVQNKGTNKAIFDIVSILGYDRLTVYKYYLMKKRKFDSNGVPITVKKNVDGEEVYDNEKMYDIHFQKVKLDESDIYKALTDKSNSLTYQEVTEPDPYWWDDANLKKELYDSEYNYVETKYMGVTISYRMTRILFENVYMMKLLLDNKEKIPYITLEIPKIQVYNEMSLFDAIVTLCAMVCKQNNLTGEVLTKSSQILHVMGFNFHDSFEKIKEDIKNDKYIDDDIYDFFNTSPTYTAIDINNLYDGYIGLRDFLIKKMESTQDIYAYESYKKLYNTIFYTKESREMFLIGTDNDGNPKYAKTFLDYLEITNPDIYKLINDVDKDRMYEYINHISSSILSIIPNLKYLGFFYDTSDTIEAMLMELIRFFKSYTTDMLDMSIIYIFDFKPELLLRLIDNIKLHVNEITKDEFYLAYADHLNFTSNTKEDDYFKLNTTIDNYIGIIFNDQETNTKLRDNIKYIYDRIIAHENMKLIYSDKPIIHNNLFIESGLRFLDDIKSLLAIFLLPNTILFKDNIKYIHDNINTNEEKFGYIDIMRMMTYFYTDNDGYELRDTVSYLANRTGKDKLFYTDLINSIFNKLTVKSINALMDVSSIKSETVYNDKNLFRDTYKIIYN